MKSTISRLLPAIAWFALINTAQAQVPMKTVVEHFTNTKCSVCAGRNPGFYSNLNNHQDVLHLAIHPSSPYPGCLLYQQNAAGNDARTNYYGVYGGTPRLVINGSVISSSANYDAAVLFSPFLSQTSPASIVISQTRYGNDSIRSRVTVKTVGSHSLGNLSLFVALAEDTVFYTGSNGEPQHFDVFRKALTPAVGLGVNLPANMGDSIVFTASATVNPVWNFSRINTYAILQQSTGKTLVQAEKYSSPVILSAADKNKPLAETEVFPNPSRHTFYLNHLPPQTRLEVFNANGKLLLSQYNEGRTIIDLSEETAGIYFLRLTSDEFSLTKKLVLLNP